PFRCHFHPPPPLGSKGQTGLALLRPPAARKSGTTWSFGSGLPAWGGPPHGLVSPPEPAGVQHLAKGQHGRGTGREGTRGRCQILGTTWYSVPPRTGRRTSGRRGTVALQDSGKGSLAGRPAWGGILEVALHNEGGHFDNLLGVDPPGSFGGMLGAWGLWCPGFAQSVLGELEVTLRGCLDSGTPTLGSPAARGRKEGGSNPQATAQPICLCRHRSKTAPWAERRRPPGPSAGWEAGGFLSCVQGLGTAGPGGALSTPAAPGLLGGPGIEPTRPRSARCLHSSRACPLLHPGSRHWPKYSAATEAAPGCAGDMADTPRDAGLKQAPAPRNEKAPVDFGYSGLGKSTLINTLFKSKISRKSVRPASEERIPKTIEIKSITHDIEEKGVRMKLTVIDTPGFGDHINNENCWQPIMKFINDQYEKYLQEEVNINRKKRIPDTRVHCCLYFIPATGHSLRPLDIEFMKRLSKVVNIVPVIAKADTLTLEERVYFKQRITADLLSNGIDVYPQKEFDEDSEDRLVNEKFREMIPFAVVGSDHEYQVNGKRILGRKTKWGTIEGKPRACWAGRHPGREGPGVPQACTWLTSLGLGKGWAVAVQ
ncbi:hypothetical protein MC885_017269, partial [Smutsia gigantea]